MQCANKMSNFQLVGYFHQVFGHPMNSTLVDNVLTENPKLVQLRINLIGEEVNELAQAIKDNNVTELIDALGDILYVVYGAGQAFGINLDTFFKNRCVCNYFILEHVSAITCQTYPKLDLIGSNFQCCCEVRRSMGYKNQLCTLNNIIVDEFELINMHFGFIENNFIRFKKACLDNNITEVINSLGDLLYTTYSMAHAIGVNMDIAFAIVHESNMTKICKTEQEAIDSIEYYKTKPGFETANVKYRPTSVGPFYAMYNADTGKILKSKDFKEPNFRLLFE